MNKKIIHLEVIRILSMIGVVFNHVGSDLYMYANDTLTFAISLICTIVSEASIPLFFMISGILLLGREESWVDVYKKRVLRIAEVIVLFTTIRFLYECFISKTMSFSIVYLVKAILTGNLMHTYWFLYAYLSILLILPIIRLVAKHIDEQGWKFLLGLIAVFYVLIPLKAILIKQEWPIVLLLNENICCLFLGYFMEYGLEKRYFNLRNNIIVLVGAAGAILLSFVAVVRPYINGGEFAVELITLLSMPIACAIFYFVRGISLKIESVNKVVANVVVQMGSCVFGVYLIEDYLRAMLAWSYMRSGISIDRSMLTIGMTFLTIIIGISIVYIGKKLPILKRIL